MKKNIVLIGMPAVGKSTVGVILAKLLGYEFIDTDILIQKKEEKLLREIIAEKGVDGFIRLENCIVSELRASNAVIATGGSVVYGEDAMRNLSAGNIVVYLRLDYNKLKYRLKNLENRGVLIRDGQSLKALYDERAPLYEKYAGIVIDTDNCGVEKTVSRIMAETERSL